MIRDATHADIPAMVALGAQMHHESPTFRDRPWNGDKVAATVLSLIENVDGIAVVYERDGAIIGAFVGLCFEDWFGSARSACDLALYVTADKRGGMAGIRLARHYREWAQSRGADPVMIGTTTGVETDVAQGLYRAAGFRPAGHLYEIRGA